MSFLGGLFNGGSGSGFKATGAPVQNAATLDQAATGYDKTQQGIAQQTAFNQALQAQNGLGNQSSVFNQMQGVANGTGPNPAQAQLAQATGANVANQASLMAGQRGAGANAGMMARQAAQLQAQQSLGALGQMGGIAGQQANQAQQGISSLNASAQNQYGQTLGALNNQNQNAINMQSNMNNVNGQIANTNAGAQDKMGSDMTSGALKGGSSAIMGAIGLADGGVVPAAPLSFGDYIKKFTGSSTSADSKPIAQGQAPTNTAKPSEAFQAGDSLGSLAGKGIGAGVNAIGSLFSSAPGGSNTGTGGPGNVMTLAKGGKIPKVVKASGGERMGQHIKGESIPMQAPMLAQGGVYAPSNNPKLQQTKKVPAMVSPGEMYLSPQAAQRVAAGKESPQAEGELIPGKASVKGNSLKNDTVPKTLEAGGCVIPRSVMESDDPMRHAIAFVHAHMSKAKRMGAKK